MSEEARLDPSLPTTAQLHREMEWIKELVDTKISAVEADIKLRSESSREAVLKSEAGYEKRFASMNDFRGQMSDQAAKFMTSVESRAMHAASAERITALTDRLNRSDSSGKGKDEGRNELRSNIVGGIGALVGIASLFMFLSSLNSKIDTNQMRIKAVEATK